MEIVGYKNNASKAVLIVHLEEIIQGDNPELAKVLFTNGTLEDWKINQNKTLTYSSFDPTKFLRGDQYTSYIGTSTNENCEKALIIHSQHSEFISKDQMANFGGSKMGPLFQPKTLFNNLTVMQNFAPISLDHWDPLAIVLRESDLLVPAFPVAIQYGSIMHNPNDVIVLGDIPQHGVPFWKKLPKGATVVRTKILPKVAVGFKIMVYYYLKDLSTNKFYPKYIVVPRTFKPNKGVQPAKIPVAIRSKNAYPNLSRQVVLVDMKVSYMPPEKKKIPIEKRIQKLQAALKKVKNAGGLAWQSGGTVQADSAAAGGKQAKNESSAEFEISRMCTKIKFEVILNVRRRAWGDIDGLPENLRALIHECEQYQYHVNGENGEKTANETTNSTNKTESNKAGQAVKSKDQDNLTNVIHNGTKENVDIVKKLCQKHELHVVLNREGANSDINDYVKHFCKDKVIHNQEHKHLVMLAKLRKELSGYLAKRDLALNNMDSKNQIDLQSSSGPLRLSHF